MKQLPKTMYVKYEKDGDDGYFVADAEMYGLVAMGEKVKIGTYRLVEVEVAEVVVKTTKAR
jgi:hypothetical protein